MKDDQFDEARQSSLKLVEASYQTVALERYSPELRERAVDLFRRVGFFSGSSRARQFKGSYSILEVEGEATAAKIVIYEAGKGKLNGPDLMLADGVYVLIRVYGSTIGRTIGIAPNHSERFAFFRLGTDQDPDDVAAFIATCAGITCSVPPA